ncbi:TonB-dependent receptor plug domain-containing protein [Sphingobacterium humi]|uniref:TonB-dependent receptor plug domain-containing protein n=2 Tax=Sphingobacterium humi TaxID=1796905 RepID=A0A6N8KUN3_9SPHI|nr:TonB-dependent receptor plug domain-containing protein [Sphingobacterium humi]
MHIFCYYLFIYSRPKWLLVIASICIAIACQSQTPQRTIKPIQILVVDSLGQQPLPASTIKDQYNTTAITSPNGMATLFPSTKQVKLTISLLGYAVYTKSIFTDTIKSLIKINLQTNQQILQEVYITGQEKNGITSATLIRKEAMEVLQPSSFADLLELLPGKRFQKPQLTSANPMALRETGVNDKNYQMAIYGGISFVIDGQAKSVQSNLQSTGLSDMLIDPQSGYANASRNILGLGVDMRTLATDHIQEIEVIRGIPSVQYGNLTSGLVTVKRKAGASPLSLRFKSDGLSKLFYIGKGLEINENKNIYVGIDFLQAFEEPTNPYENFNRLGSIIKYEKSWHSNTHSKWIWQSSLDLHSTLDREKTDVDQGNSKINKYTSKQSGFTISEYLKREQLGQQRLTNLELWLSLDLQQQTIEQTKWIQLTNPVAIPHSLNEGEHDGIYLPGQYTSNLLIKGLPIALNSKILVSKSLDKLWMKHKLNLGSEWTYDKNLGQGQVYNTLLPPFYGSGNRPKVFKSILANQELSFFMEDQISWLVHKHHLQFIIGIRNMHMLGIPSNFENLKRWKWDPRIQFAWGFPTFQLFNKPIQVNMDMGWGTASRKPYMTQLSPELLYWDFIQLNFFHENPAYRRVNFQTYHQLPYNPRINYAVNSKKEIRLSIRYANSYFTISSFEELMKNGFRINQHYRSFPFKRYQIDSGYVNQLQGPPELEKLNYIQEKQLRTYSVIENGTQVRKKGIEFQITSPRFSFLNSRITADGAWYLSNYQNSIPVYKEPKSPILFNGVRMQYLGLYQMDEGYINEVFSNKISIDHYLKHIGFTFFSSYQFRWFETRKSAWNDGLPFRYVDINGSERDFSPSELANPQLRQLVILYGKDAFNKRRYPLQTTINMKASKEIGKLIKLSMYVNSLFSYTKSSKGSANQKKAKGINSPYFGMELNFQL